MNINVKKLGQVIFLSDVSELEIEIIDEKLYP